MFIFQDTRPTQMTYIIKWWHYGRTVVTIGVRSGLCPFEGRWKIAWGLSRAHRWLFLTLNTPSPENMFRQSIEFYVKDLICTVLVCPEISSVDAMDHHEVLPGPSVGIVTVVVRYLLIDWCQYDLWANCILVSRMCYNSCLTQTLVQPSKHIGFWIMSTWITWRIFPCSCTSSNITGTQG
jgi:hypothetical protein